MFQAAKQTKVFQDVVEQIQEAILDGRLIAGQTLPAESASLVRLTDAGFLRVLAPGRG